MIITDLLRLHAEQFPRNPCITAQDSCLTYQEFYELVNKIANTLLSFQTRRLLDQPKVALLLDNSVEFLLVFFASAKIGWLVLILDPKWPLADIATTLIDADPDALVIQDHYIDRLGDIAQKTKLIIVPSPGSTYHDDSTINFTQLLHGSSDEPEVQVSDTDPFLVGYTSGTTGKPKGFVRNHRSWVASFRVSNTAFHVGVGSCVMAPGPLVHSLSLYAAVSTLFAAGTFYLIRKFNAPTVLALLSSSPISHIYFVPTMFEALSQESERSSNHGPIYHLRNIISTGDKWSPLSKRHVKYLFPAADLYEFYGASELSFVTILDPQGNNRKPDSVGRPADTVRISLRDRYGQEVKRGEIGQLYVQSNMLFSGYYFDPDGTKEVLQDGWGTVGDLAREDEEGFIYIVGRKSNMIISGGLNIYPEEIERVLLRLPQIDEAIVIGMPDTYWGERVTAVITLKSGASLGDDAIKAQCKEHLAAYKCPREIIRVASFPHTLSGKILRGMVCKQLTNRSQD